MVKAAENKYGVPKSTFDGKLKKKIPLVLWKHTTLSKVSEHLLAYYLIKLGELSIGLSAVDIRSISSIYLKDTGQQGLIQNGYLSNDWFYDFMKLNHDLRDGKKRKS